ncbi:ATP-dependent DNA helicase [Frankliniella fusca]|uniref:ATP-dependent DNA helicase n=1 Tax=Frankliniella fusca TaxID=407009 RepID=A0AAE1H5V5_9NEOP|nr:ATP-dependent DNA helicase [Frankliniella fusca]
MEKVKFIVLDEFSMVSCSLLGMIDKRIREGTGKDEPFGGLNVYLCGDYKQLPPVMGTALYGGVCHSELALHGRNMFDSFEAHCVLTKGHRPSDVIFQELLDRLSVGEVTEEDYDMLSRRFASSGDERKNFDDAIHLFANKVQVALYNDHKLRNQLDESGNFVGDKL